MSGYGIDPDPVYNSGRTIHGFGTEAWVKADRVLQSLRDAGGVVAHPLVTSAVNGFCDNHAGDAYALQNAIENCGANIAGTATDCVDGENEMTAAHAMAATQGEQVLSTLDRQL